MQDIKSNPNSRRMIVSAWNPEYVEEMALPPCHCLFQFYVANNKLSCQLYQRSADIFLGVPFNIASYSLLTEMIAKSCGLEASEFIITLGDAHLYDNHKEQANLQIKRELKNLPILKINKKDNIENYIYDDFEIIDYNPHPIFLEKLQFNNVKNYISAIVASAKNRVIGDGEQLFGRYLKTLKD